MGQEERVGRDLKVGNGNGGMSSQSSSFHALIMQAVTFFFVVLCIFWVVAERGRELGCSFGIDTFYNFPINLIFLRTMIPHFHLKVGKICINFQLKHPYRFAGRCLFR